MKRLMRLALVAVVAMMTQGGPAFAQNQTAVVTQVPVRSIDDHDLGEPGEITRVVQTRFDDALHGRAQEYLEWLDLVEQPSRVTS